MPMCITTPDKLIPLATEVKWERKWAPKSQDSFCHIPTHCHAFDRKQTTCSTCVKATVPPVQKWNHETSPEWCKERLSDHFRQRFGFVTLHWGTEEEKRKREKKKECWKKGKDLKPELVLIVSSLAEQSLDSPPMLCSSPWWTLSETAARHCLRSSFSF